jgi:thiol-disulfide isomerase/thioredoxin
MPAQNPAVFRKLLAISFLVVLVLAVIWIGAKYRNAFAGVIGRPVLPAPEVGSLAPNFELVALSGAAVRLTNALDKPVFINFWATWCAPCVLEMPNLQKYYETYGDEFEILAINAGESEWDVGKFVDDIGITFPVLLDPQSKITIEYKVQGFPTTYILSSDGIIQAVHIGMLSENKIEEYLESVGAIK